MKILHTIWFRLRSLTQRSAVKQEIDDELRFHIEQRAAENVAAGMPPEEAAQAARKRFGNFQAVREECRENRGILWLENLLSDISYGARQLRKNPGFAAVAALTLALGIGANTAIFSIADRLLVRPLPVSRPEQLALLGMQYGNEYSFDDFNYPLFKDYQRGNTVFSQLAATAGAQG